MHDARVNNRYGDCGNIIYSKNDRGDVIMSAKISTQSNYKKI